MTAPEMTKKKERKKEGEKSGCFTFSVFIQHTQHDCPAPSPVDSLPV
jgi:hypothetical protein